MIARLLTIAIVLSFALSVRADDKATTPPGPADAKPDRVVAIARSAQRTFTGKLYAILADEHPEQNFVFSPFGAFESLLMLELGARDETAESLRRLVGPGRDWAEACAAMRLSGAPRIFAAASAVGDNAGYGVKLSAPIPFESDFSRAGLEAGDLIFSINDEPVRSVEEFHNLCRTARGTMTLTGYSVRSGLGYQNRNVTLHAVPIPDAKPENRPVVFACAIWIRSDLAKKSGYPAELEKLYGAKTFRFPVGSQRNLLEPKPPDLDAAASKFFKQETGGKIDRVAFVNLPPLLKLLIVNVLAMNAEWDRKFDVNRTKPGKFQAPEGPVQADYMFDLAQFSFASLEESLVLELPYRDSDLRFRVYLPKVPGQLPALEKQLTSETQLDEAATQALASQLVSVALPKFRVETSGSHKAALKALGLAQMFTRNANFTGIDPTDDLMADDVRQQVFVEVDENGTRAGAKTEVRLKVKGGAAPGTPIFHATHPFLFQVRDSAGTIFLMGRVTKPLPPKGPGKEALDK